jgi:transcriptional regulator with XRE-family HTH domain
VPTPSEPTPFGEQLKFWRLHHSLTQLELAVAAQTTTRHLSFLETGRSRPSAGMVERLCEALQVPVRERNSLFAAAGMAGPYGTDGLFDPAVEPFLSAVDSLLLRHAPYPAFAFDRRWNVARANPTAKALLGEDRPNLVELLYHGPWRDLIANWESVAWAGVDRLRGDVLTDPRDHVLRGHLERATASLANVPRPKAVGSDLAICPVFRVGDHELRTVTLTAYFGSPRHVATDELRVELIFPETDADRRLLESFVQTSELDGSESATE